MFSGRPSVSASVRAPMRACVPLARYLRTEWREFHQTLVHDVVEAKNKLVKFWRLKSQGQGQM